MDILALVGETTRQVVIPAVEGGTGFQINLFWVIVSAVNFIVFFLIVKSLAFKGLTQTLDTSR